MKRYSFNVEICANCTDLQNAMFDISVVAETLEEALEIADNNIKSHTVMDFFLDYDYSEECE